MASASPRTAGETSPVVLGRAEPQVFVADIDAAAHFYEHQLGFRVVFRYGSPPFYGQVKRDAATLDLRRVAHPPIPPGVRDREELLSAAITLATRSDTERLAAEFAQRGVTFFQLPAVQPWGAFNFIVRDLDGNLLLFAGSASNGAHQPDKEEDAT